MNINKNSYQNIIKYNSVILKKKHDQVSLFQGCKASSIFKNQSV